jgi:hypothetical protein
MTLKGKRALVTGGSRGEPVIGRRHPAIGLERLQRRQ